MLMLHAAKCCRFTNFEQPDISVNGLNDLLGFFILADIEFSWMKFRNCNLNMRRCFRCRLAPFANERVIITCLFVLHHWGLDWCLIMLHHAHPPAVCLTLTLTPAGPLAQTHITAITIYYEGEKVRAIIRWHLHNKCTWGSVCGGLRLKDYSLKFSNFKVDGTLRPGSEDYLTDQSNLN